MLEKSKFGVKMKRMDKIEETLTRGVEQVYPDKANLAKLMRQRKIRLYQGFDPSMANLHLGNMVGILKLKQFQDLGHEVIFLVGDFTGMIGDPTDKASTRRLLTRAQVLENSKTWREQAGRVLKFTGKNPAKILYNSQWSDRVTFKDLIEITSNFTVQQIMERDFFQRRLKAQKPIHLHEFLYPVAQGIDCVEMDVDLEIGGSDQTFNMLVGRTLMKAMKKKEKFVLTTKLLVDAKGEKVGKTAGNALFLNTSPANLYGGLMSFPDEVIILGFELLTQLPMLKIRENQQALEKGKVNPMVLKKQLAFEIVKMYHGEKEAKSAEKEFEWVAQKGKSPSQIPPSPKPVKPGVYLAPQLCFTSGATVGTAEAKRLIRQGGVEFEGKKIMDPQKKLTVKGGEVLRTGKRKIFKIKIN